MNAYKTFSILNVLGFVLVLTINGLANALPINGMTTGEISDLFPNFFVPAGITFTIWGIIYLLLLGFVIYQFFHLKGADKTPGHFIPRISFFFFFNCIINSLWIFTWHYQRPFLALILMLLLLISLIYIYIRLDIGIRNVGRSEFFLVHVPFSIYLGWITVATIANTTAVLVDLNWGGLGISGQIWAVIMIGVASIVGNMVYRQRKDLFYVLVLIWAFLGILIKRNSIAGIDDIVAIGAISGIILLILSIIINSFFLKQAAKQK